MNVRAADGDEELRAAIRCYNRAWRVGFRGVAPEDVIEASLRDTDEDGVADFQELTSGIPSILLVALRDDEVVGYVFGRHDRTSEFVADEDAEIVELYVDPAHWREGVGSRLLEQFLEWLPDHCEGVVTKILGGNDRAQSFLEAHGFAFQDTDVLELDGDIYGGGIYRRPLER